MMTNQREKPYQDKQVILLALPAGLLDGLPEEDQRAITAMLGKSVTLLGYDRDGRAELHFDDPFDAPTEVSRHTHTIWVEPDCIGPVEE